MTATVSVVVPTVGRPSLARAVQSALDQTRPPTEVIVVAGTDALGSLPRDDRLIVLRHRSRGGPAQFRQVGIDAAHGSVIALLDDDDEWFDSKLERQLAAVHPESEADWIASSRMAVLGPGSRRRTWPTRLIGPRQSVVDYLFRVTEIGVGGAVLQSSTLMFPVDLARKVRMDVRAEAIHDEATWLMEVQRVVPDLRLIHVPDVLSTYNVGSTSLSRSSVDRTADYIDWGQRYLHAESPRVRGDYLCTCPVSAAVSAGSLTGVRDALWSAFTHGRPGPFALAYAVLNAGRIAGRRFVSTVRR